MDRKEAIEIVRKNYPHVGFSGSEFESALRELVPEFKEQPDPRHSLIEFIKWSCDRGCITPEQRKNVDFWLAYLERQKEQKPVKLNDDTEVGLDRALQIVKAAKGNLCGYQSDDGIYECCHAIQTLERILKNGIEHQSAEWSKEDERILCNVIAYVGYAAGQRGVKDDLFKEANDWLKSLRPQPSLQPNINHAVWHNASEEKPTRLPIIHIWYHGNRVNTVVAHENISLQEELDDINFQPDDKWAYVEDLLNIQPHWKPSEEQMDALETAISSLQSTALESLHNDLKNYFYTNTHHRTFLQEL